MLNLLVALYLAACICALVFVVLMVFILPFKALRQAVLRDWHGR